MSYSDLQPKVFHALREIGNAILFALYITQALVNLNINITPIYLGLID